VIVGDASQFSDVVSPVALTGRTDSRITAS
jgi:hypothetical protein